MAAADAAAVGRSEGGEGGGLAAGVSIQYLRQRLKALQLANSSTSSASSSLHSSSIAPSSFSSSSSSSSSSSWSRGVAREESLEEMQKRKMVGADEALHRWRREGKILEGGMSRIDLDSLRVRKTNDRAEEKEKEEEQKRNDQQLNKVSGLSNPMVKANDNDSIDSGFLFRMRNREEDAKKNSEMGLKPCQNGRINKEEVGLIDSMDEPYSSRLNLSFRRMKNGEEEEKKSSEMGPEPHQNGRNDKHADPSDSMDKPCNSSPDFRFCRMKNGEEEDEKKNTEVGSKPCKYAQINKEVGLSNSMEPPLNSSLDFGYCLRKNREAEVEKILGLKPYRYGLLNKDSSSINLTEKTGDGSVDSRCPRKVKNGEEVEKKNLEMGLKPYQNGRLNKEAGPSNLPEKPFDGSLSSGCSQVHRMKNREEDVKQRSVMGSKTCQNGLLSKDSSYTNLTEKTDNSSIDSRFLCQMKNEDEELAKGWKRYQNVILKKDLSLSNPTERPDDSNIDSGFLCQMKNREVDERKDKPYQNGQINKEAYPSDSMEKPFNSNLDSGYSRVNRTKSREEDVKQSSEIGSKPHWNGLLIKDLGLNNPMERLYNSSLDYGCSRVNGTNSREGNEKQKSVVKALNPYRNGLLNKDSTLSPLEEEPDSSGPDSGTKNGEEEEDEKQTSPKPYGNGFLGRGTSLNNPAEPKEVPQLSRSSLMNSSSRFSCEETKKNPQRLAQPLNYYSSFDRSKAVENSSYPIKSTMEADEDDNVEESDSVNLPKSGLNHNGLKSRILTEPNVAQLTPLTPALSTLSTANPYQIKSVNEEKGLVSSEMVGESSYKEEEDKEEELKGGVKLPKSAPGRAIMGVSSLSRSNHNVVGSIGGSVSKQSVVLQTTPSTPALPVLASVLTPQLRLPRQFTFSQSKPNKPNLSALRVLVESDINEEKNADTKHSAAIGGKCNSKEAAVDGAPAVLKKTVPAVLSNLTNMAKNEPPRMKSVLMKRPASNYECANGEKENMIEGRHSIATRLHNEKGGGNSSKKYSHAEDRKATVKLGSAMLTTTELTPNVSLNLVEKSHVSMGQGEGNNKSMVASTCSSDIAPTMGASSVVETQSNNNTSECNFAPKMPHLLPTAPCSMTFRSTSAPPLSYTSSQDIPKMAEKEAKRSKQEFPQENEEKNVPLAKVEKAPLHQPTTTHRKQRWETEHCVWVNGKRYQKLGKIGSGGSSEVYKVIASDCTIYALKRIQLKGRDYSSACGFYQEISYLEKLRGRNNIIQMIDYEVTDKSVFHLENGPSRIKTDVFIYMVLEYGEIDLAHMLSDKWKERSQTGEELDENWLRLYWQQILKAVNTIHEERIVHSDLKPANFLLVKGMLKLIDFGIAKAIQNEDTTNIVRESQVGTVNYMAPEAFLTNQVDDENGKIFKCGRSSDIWSLGCILYQMVYGCTPFSHVTHLWAKVTEISNRQHKINFPPISNPDIIDIMKRCLTWNREERPRIPQLLEHPFLRPTSRYASHQFHLHKTEMKNHLSKETAYNQAPEVQTVVSQDLGD